MPDQVTDFFAITPAYGSPLLVVLCVALLAVLLSFIAILSYRKARQSKQIGQLGHHLEALIRGDFQSPASLAETGDKPLDELVVLVDELTKRLVLTRDQHANYQKELETQLVSQRTELRQVNDRANRVTQTDPLTSLPNRLLFRRSLEQAINRASIDNTHVAVLFIDLDSFKQFNDRLGHESGDLVLCTASERLRSALNPQSMLARFGGDEFVAMMTQLTPRESSAQAQALAERFIESLTQPFTVGGDLSNLSASIGYAIYPNDGLSASELLKNADTAMYAAKQNGRNRIEEFSGGFGRLQAERARFEHDLRVALPNGEFFLMFQPQSETRTGIPVGVEALMRWRHPKRGLIQPAQFIGLSEEIGLIHQLGQHALELACEAFMRWSSNGMRPRISVNVSARQFEERDWISGIERAIERTGIRPEYLDLEITESILIGSPQRFIETLHKLRDIGVSLTLDDFGTGYSNLSYLTRLPFKTIKIDRSFIAHLDNPSTRSVVHAIVAVAHSLNMRVIGEGVETPLQLSILQELGCEEIQGFYLSPPLDENALQAWWTLHSTPLVLPTRPLLK